ncbi:hypothetical protein B0H10DRAFT_2231025 [Mycena sp. CBHHK59/15]|nr:hypothetical protein B0H10DRAFT_2231025 [Mycena sp. CBHHK59/15]
MGELTVLVPILALLLRLALALRLRVRRVLLLALGWVERLRNRNVSIEGDVEEESKMERDYTPQRALWHSGTGALALKGAFTLCRLGARFNAPAALRLGCVFALWRVARCLGAGALAPAGRRSRAGAALLS